MAAFGDGTLYVERLVEQPRHVEFQILADHHGHVVHLFERECSIQRRHQKVIEETPSTALTPGAAAAHGRRRRSPSRAPPAIATPGTVEFLLEGTGDAARFYFLEMNTRLQVEHPVTEQVTGVDLVRAQIAIAAGEPLPWTQDELCAARPRHRGARLRGGSGAATICRRPARCCSTASRRCQASASMPASPKAPRSASTTTRCSPS